MPNWIIPSALSKQLRDELITLKNSISSVMPPSEEKEITRLCKPFVAEFKLDIDQTRNLVFAVSEIPYYILKPVIRDFILGNIRPDFGYPKTGDVFQECEKRVKALELQIVQIDRVLNAIPEQATNIIDSAKAIAALESLRAKIATPMNEGVNQHLTIGNYTPAPYSQRVISDQAARAAKKEEGKAA